MTSNRDHDRTDDQQVASAFGTILLGAHGGGPGGRGLTGCLLAHARTLSGVDRSGKRCASADHAVRGRQIRKSRKEQSPTSRAISPGYL